MARQRAGLVDQWKLDQFRTGGVPLHARFSGSGAGKASDLGRLVGAR